MSLKDTDAPVFIAVLFTTATIRKQAKCPSKRNGQRRCGTWIQWNAAAAAKLLQSCPTPCDPIDGSPPSFPVPGILQAGTLEWAAISFSSA